MEFVFDPNTAESRLAAKLAAGIDYPRRTLYISGEVDLAMAHRVVMTLQVLDADTGPIRIILNSNGGEEEQGYAIYDAIMACQNHVTIDGYGEVQSIAAAILQAGNVRRLSPNAIFLIHNGTAPEFTGQSHDEAVAMGKTLEKQGNRYHVILSCGSQQQLDTIKEWCRHDHYLLAEEALEAGFCDEIIQPNPDKVRKPPRKKKATK